MLKSGHDYSGYDSHIVVGDDGQFIWYDETGDVGGICATRQDCYEEMDVYAYEVLG